jgi:hypothetical protein
MVFIECRSHKKQCTFSWEEWKISDVSGALPFPGRACGRCPWCTSAPRRRSRSTASAVPGGASPSGSPLPCWTWARTISCVRQDARRRPPSRSQLSRHRPSRRHLDASHHRLSPPFPEWGDHPNQPFSLTRIKKTTQTHRRRTNQQHNSTRNRLTRRS